MAKKKPKISIVTGTYNRLTYLMDCIDSIRASVGKIPYEIIVVDGGSTDNTVEWLKEQKDVVLIEQGGLLGACRAFNAGFAMAQGKYCVNLNDDLIVVGDAIATMYEFMEENPEVAQGAFYYKLGHMNEYIVNKLFTTKIYANYGMTRRELGDKYGWWGDYYTYGGDTEISAQLIRHDHKVVGVPEAKLIDLQAKDQLRDHNHRPAGDTTVNMIDNKRFWSRWDEFERKGIYKEIPKTEEELIAETKIEEIEVEVAQDGEMRVLHVALNTPTDTQPGLERALRALGPYKQLDWQQIKNEYGLMLMNQRILDEAIEFKPDLIFIQVQTDVLDPFMLYKLKSILPGCVIANWNGDVRPTMPPWMSVIGAKIDLTLITNKSQTAEYLRKGCRRVEYLQIGFDEEVFKPDDGKRDGKPVVFMGSNYGQFPLSEERLQMVRLLELKYGKQFRVFGQGWGEEDKMLDHHAEAQAYNRAQIAIGISAFDYECYTSDRLFRAMGSGVLYLTKYFSGLETMFENGEHLIWWRDIAELPGLIDTYLDRAEKGREYIAKTGCEYVHKHHTWLSRAFQLRKMVREIVNA